MLNGRSAIFYGRILAGLLGVTYIFWFWTCLWISWVVFHGWNPPLDELADWWAFADEARVYVLALGMSALVVVGLSVGVLWIRRPWVVKLAAASSALQFPVLLWGIGRDSGSVAGVAPLVVSLALLLAILWSAYRWHGASRAEALHAS